MQRKTKEPDSIRGSVDPRGAPSYGMCRWALSISTFTVPMIPFSILPPDTLGIPQQRTIL